MSYFAKVENKLVTQIIAAEQDFIDSLDGQWVQTSYNTRAGIHYAPNSNDPDGGIALRKNYAGVGFTYDEVRDAFIPPKEYDSWVLNDETCQWESPVSYPDDGNMYLWNEETKTWESI
jgi:hypothetical protein